MSDEKIPSPPRGCGTAGRKLWRAVMADYTLETHEAALLERACRVADACADLQAVVDAEGTMTTTRLGEVKAHPALVELRAQGLVLARLIVALRVPIGEEDGSAARGPVRAVRGVYGLQVAK